MAQLIRERKVAAVVGALVADAAAQPIHWNYDVNKLDAILGETDDVTFWTPSINPFYNIDVGRQTCYGDQSYVILKSLVEDKGLDADKLLKRTYDFFGPESEYEDKVNMDYKNKSDAADKTKYPIKRPWRHASIKDMLKNVQAEKSESGSETDEQIDCQLRVVSVVALYAGHPDMLEKAEAVIRQTQNSDLCLSVGLAAARLLEYFILHGESAEALDHVVNELSNQKRANPHDLDKSMASFLREVQRRKDEPHIQTARSIRIS